MLNEIKTFLNTITDWAVLLVAFTFFFFTCNVEPVTVLDRTSLLPVPSTPSFAAEFFQNMVADVAPAGVPIIVTSPLTAFVVQVKIAFMLAFLFTLPVFLWRLMRFLAPALYEHEQRAMSFLVIPLTGLFFGGMVFAYAYLLPLTFAVLYAFAEPISAVTLLGATEFVGISLALLLFSGAVFTVPVFMISLTAMRVISAHFWFAHARYALVFFLILSAIITPDGSGVSMVLLTLPVSLLYGAGALICTRIERTESSRTTSVMGEFKN